MRNAPRVFAWTATAMGAQTRADVPIGSIMAWHKSFPNTPSLPAGWVECNGQILNEPGSPYDGQTIPDLNGALSNVQRFIRGGGDGVGGTQNRGRVHGEVRDVMAIHLIGLIQPVEVNDHVATDHAQPARALRDANMMKPETIIICAGYHKFCPRIADTKKSCDVVQHVDRLLLKRRRFCKDPSSATGA